VVHELAIVYRKVRPYLPGLAVLAALMLVQVAVAAPSNPDGVTNQSCGVGQGIWNDGVRRIVGGLSMLLIGGAVLSGVAFNRSGSGGGGDVAAGAIGGFIGVAAVLGIVGLVGLLAAIVNQAAGLPPCP
jgi:hypothetical protein